MIRFVDLGKQLGVLEEDDPENDWPRQFAFFNTIDSQFIKIAGYVVFDSLSDFLQAVEQEDEVDPIFINRLLGLMPEWARMVPAPRQNLQIFGFKG